MARLGGKTLTVVGTWIFFFLILFSATQQTKAADFFDTDGIPLDFSTNRLKYVKHPDYWTYRMKADFRAITGVGFNAAFAPEPELMSIIEGWRPPEEFGQSLINIAKVRPGAGGNSVLLDRLEFAFQNDLLTIRGDRMTGGVMGFVASEFSPSGLDEILVDPIASYESFGMPWLDRRPTTVIPKLENYLRGSIVHEATHWRVAQWRRFYAGKLGYSMEDPEYTRIVKASSYLEEMLAQRNGFLAEGYSKRRAMRLALKNVEHADYLRLQRTKGLSMKASIAALLENPPGGPAPLRLRAPGLGALEPVSFDSGLTRSSGRLGPGLGSIGVNAGFELIAMDALVQEMSVQSGRVTPEEAALASPVNQIMRRTGIAEIADDLEDLRAPINDGMRNGTGFYWWFQRRIYNNLTAPLSGQPQIP